MSTCQISCLESSLTPLHMPKPNASKNTVFKTKAFCPRNLPLNFGKYIGLPSEANCWIIFSEQSWIHLRDELLDHSPRQFFGKSSLKFLSQSFSLFFSFSCHALTPIVLGCPCAYGMHYANSKQFTLIYFTCMYINKFNSHNSCYSIHNQ